MKRIGFLCCIAVIAVAAFMVSGCQREATTPVDVASSESACETLDCLLSEIMTLPQEEIGRRIEKFAGRDTRISGPSLVDADECPQSLTVAGHVASAAWGLNNGTTSTADAWATPLGDEVRIDWVDDQGRFRQYWDVVHKPAITGTAIALTSGIIQASGSRFVVALGSPASVDWCIAYNVIDGSTGVQTHDLFVVQYRSGNATWRAMVLRPA